MRTLGVWSVALVMTLAVVAQANASIRNDAGSGMDAPSDPAAALPITWGSFSGYAWKADVDWYAPPAASDASCVEATVSGARGVTALDVGGRSVASAYNGSTAKLALATQLASPVLFSVEGRTVSNQSGDYSVVLREVLGVAHDGGDSASTATPVGSGCLAGRVGSSDLVDFFEFTLDQRGWILLSGASTGSVTFTLRSATGDVLATLAPGDIIALDNLASGSYTMSASSTSFANPAYTLALMLPPPCKPNC